MIRYRIVALFTAALMALTCLSACTGGNSPVGGDSSGSLGDATVSPESTQTPPATPPATSAAEATALPAITLTPVSADDIPAFSGGTKKQDYDCGDGVYMRHVSMVLATEFNAYIEKLPTLGFTETSHREVSGNSFYSFARDGISLAASYFKADKIATLTVLPYDPYSAYADIYKKDGSADGTEGDVEPLLTMLEISEDKVNGMCYMIRTTTGSFIIIDGGWMGVGDGKKIMKILREQNTRDGLPEVAAWILTHPHSDHIGGMADVAAAYYDEIILRRVIYNFTNDEMLAKSDVAGGSSALKVIESTLQNPKKWGSAQLIKPHTGDVLNIDGVTIEILQTQEDVFPDTDALLYNNSASMAFKVTTGGHSALFTGDLSSTYMKQIATRWADELKCDILQPTHHGRTHGRVDVYRIVSPTVVMWPTSSQSYEEYKSKDYNQYLINTFPRHYISANGTVTLSMRTLEEVK